MTINAPNASHISDLRRLWKLAFGDPDTFLDSFFSLAFSPERCRCLWCNGQLAAALYWFDCEFQGQRIAYLYAVATDPAFRKQGLCHALMTDTHRLLRRQGYAAAMLVPVSPELFAFYEKLGYRTATYVLETVCEAADAPADLRPVDAAEFARLRRKYLPEGSVLQEGPALALLQSQLNFYAGDGFLCLAGWENGALHISEFLGNPACADQVIRALNAPQAVLRTPGNGKPFAMYLPLSEAILELPTYFGLALD